MNATSDDARSDPWGEYRGLIESRLASCADYLSRLTRSLAGEIAPDRFYFASKAWELRDAAEALVEACTDVEHWLTECGCEFVVEAENRRAICVLPAGHAGDHDEALGWSAAEGVYREAQKLKQAAQRAADLLAALPWRRSLDGSLRPHDADTADVLAALVSQVAGARWRGTCLAERVTALRAGTGGLP